MTDAPTKRNGPWYTHPWVWFIIIVPVASVALSFTMLYVAVSNKDSDVRDDWYKDKKAIRQDFRRDDLAASLQLQSEIAIQGQQVTVKLLSAGMLPQSATPATLNLLLSHPTDEKKDIRLVLKQGATATEYSAVFAAPPSGRFYVELGCPVWRLKDMAEFPQTALTLKPPAR